MKNKNPLTANRIILALVFGVTTFLIFEYHVVSLESVHHSLGFSSQAHHTNHMDELLLSSEQKSTLDNSIILGIPALSTSDFVDILSNESNEKHIEIPAGRLESSKNATGLVSTKISQNPSSSGVSSLRSSLPPAAPLSRPIAILHDVVYVPEGVSVPAVLAEPSSKSALDPISQEEVQTMGDTFLSNMDEQIRAGTPSDSAWRQLQKRSDDAFRARYGWEAFNKESARANQQAMISH